MNSNDHNTLLGRPRPQARRRTWVYVLAFLGVVAAFASVELVALWQSNHRGPVALEAPSTAPVEQAAGQKTAAGVAGEAIEGWVDEPPEPSVGDRFYTTGWAIAKSGISKVEIAVDGHRFEARYGKPRGDVAKLKPGYPNAEASGFTLDADLSSLSLLRRSTIEYIAVDRQGKEHTFARKSLVPSRALAMWRPLLDAEPSLAQRRFYFLMMMSGVGMGAGAEVDTQYREYVSRTMQIGIAVPILYLRTTRGKIGDWMFDPDFDTARKCRNRPVAEDNLNTVIAFAVQKRIPVQFILNGGIWADSSCAIPEWDLTDHFEEDPVNCQWTQSDQVFADDYLKGLVGSVDSPELARTLTYHVYARQVRAYKKRNLQSAARVIAAFAREHPELLVGVVLDSDTYMNPFYFQREIFDYNPGMLRQFREWLRGSGPYAGNPTDGAPDLRRYRRAHPLTLVQVNSIARRNFRSWDEVDPPRHLPGSPRDALAPGEIPFWDDPWWHEWDTFRRHIVGLHYDELSTWVRDVGIPRDKIFSAQGFIRPDPGLRPFAIRLDSHTQNYDSAGVSVEGAIPRFGHLGAVIYGEAARNDLPMEWPHSMFATFGRLDDGWGIVEYNSTDLKRPTDPPGYAEAYKTFRDAFNYGASQVSAMAWNGSNGVNVGKPGYVAFTAWRNTKSEDAMLDFLVTHADLPRGARMWTFGAPRHVDDDGWSAALGTVTAGAGQLEVRPDADRVTLLSPDDQVIRPRSIARLLMRWDGQKAPLRITVAAQLARDTPWHEVGSSSGGQVLFRWPAAWLRDDAIVERLKIELEFPAGTRAVVLSRVLLYPRALGA